MGLDTLPWRDGVAAVLAVVLLKMLWDAVYRKIPLGFKSVRRLLELQTSNAEKRHDQHLEKMTAVEDAIKHLQATKCKNGRVHKKPRPLKKKPRTK